MPEVAPAQSEALSPQAQLIQMAWAHQVSSLVRVAAELKLADHLAEGPKAAERLAQLTATHAPSLYRVMRTLASLGLFTEDERHCFALTPLGEPLRSGTPGSVRNSVLTMTGDMFCKPLANLLYSVQTGKTGFGKAFGAEIFDWLPHHPEEAAMFSDLMVGFHGPETAAVAGAYDFTGFDTIVDVGGATGNMLTTILGRHPGPRGVVFDLAHNRDGATTFIQMRGMADRIGFVDGNFFESVPSGGDAYLMSHIIHDWSEDQCLTILGNCRRAMKATSRLLIIEMVLPAGDIPHTGKMTDIVMLTVPGGQERTEREYGQLLKKGGFKLARVVPTESAASIVEAFPA
jgi:O-methyltransferase domain